MMNRRTVKMQNFKKAPYGAKILLLIFAKLSLESFRGINNTVFFSFYQRFLPARLS